MQLLARDLLDPQANERVLDLFCGLGNFTLPIATRAREVLAPLTPQDLGNEAFPYMTLRETTVGHVPVRMLRVTYVGELGWELYVSMADAAALWEALLDTGETHGTVPVGIGVYGTTANGDTISGGLVTAIKLGGAAALALYDRYF